MTSKVGGCATKVNEVLLANQIVSICRSVDCIYYAIIIDIDITSGLSLDFFTGK